MIPFSFISGHIIVIHDEIEARFAFKIILKMLCLSVLWLGGFPPIGVDANRSETDKLLVRNYLLKL